MNQNVMLFQIVASELKIAIEIINVIFFHDNFMLIRSCDLSKNRTFE